MDYAITDVNVPGDHPRNNGGAAGPVLSDSDGDDVLNESDNCPKWANPSQSLPPCPVPTGHADCDWTDADETLVTMVVGNACGFTAGAPTES